MSKRKKAPETLQQDNPASPEALGQMGIGIGRENASQYPFTLPTRTIVMNRYMEWVGPRGGLIFDPQNPRLRTTLKKSGIAPTQDNLAQLLSKECKELLPSLRISRGLHGPIFLDPDGKTVKEGNRRLRAFRELSQESQQFDLIPVECPAEKITAEEMDLILTVRHCVRPKNWESREQGKMIQKMLKKYTKEAVGEIIGRSPELIMAYQKAAEFYDDFDDFSDANPRVGQDQKTRDRDFFTYFLKIAQKPKFLSQIWENKEEKEAIYKMMLQNQFNDCLNMDQFSRVWNQPASRQALQDGMNFKDALRTYHKEMTARRGSDFWTALKTVNSGLKNLKIPDKKRLSQQEGAADLNFLEKVQGLLTATIADIKGFKIIKGDKTRNEKIA